MIFKNPNLIIFRYPFQVKLFMKYNEDTFTDGSFYIEPKFNYLVLIINTYIKDLNNFYTTFLILKNKEQSTYEMILKKLKKKKKKKKKKKVMTFN